MSILFRPSFILYLYICSIILYSQNIKAEKADSISDCYIHKIEVNLRPSYMIPTNRFFLGENYYNKAIEHTESVSLKYAFSFNPESYYGHLYPHTHQGIGFSYNTFFDKKEMGTPLALFIFQSSRITSLASRISFDYEWDFGLSWGWKPYDDINNSYNVIVGSEINAYLNAGFFLNWQISRASNLTFGIDFTHYSNGNTHYPNQGVNTIGARIGYTHTLNPATDSHHLMQHPSSSINPYLSWDMILYGAVRAKGIEQENYAVPGKFAVAGININPMYNCHRLFRFGISLDAQFDESGNIENHIAGTDQEGNMTFYRPPFEEQFTVGLSLRAELVMPIFCINIGIGQNLLQKDDESKGFYQMLALKTNITNNLYIHTGYLLSQFHTPKNLMFGLGYRFNNKINH